MKYFYWVFSLLFEFSDPKKEAKIELDGKVVSVPLGQPSKSKKWRASPFKRSKYAVYNEHQVRLRYLLKFYTADSLEETWVKLKWNLKWNLKKLISHHRDSNFLLYTCY